MIAASHGATTTNEFVNVQDFFATQVRPENNECRFTCGQI